MAADELPDGWRWLSTWDTRTPGEHMKGGPTGDYARLMKAADARKIRAYKQDNAWVVNVDDAVRFLEAAHGRIASNANPKNVSVDDASRVVESIKSLEGVVAFWGELISGKLEEIDSRSRNDK
jgi:hypothetical protein